jgi:hypothetical protein
MIEHQEPSSLPALVSNEEDHRSISNKNKDVGAGASSSTPVTAVHSTDESNDEERNPMHDYNTEDHKSIITVCNALCRDILLDPSNASTTSHECTTPSKAATKVLCHRMSSSTSSKNAGDASCVIVVVGTSEKYKRTTHVACRDVPSCRSDNSGVNDQRMGNDRGRIISALKEEQAQLVERRSKLQSIIESTQKVAAYEKSQGLMDQYALQVEFEAVAEDVEIMKEKHESLCETLFNLHLQRLELMQLQGADEDSSNGNVGSNDDRVESYQEIHASI